AAHGFGLCARRERPGGRCAAKQRDEVATFQLIGLHSVPTSQGRITGYRIGEDQSGGNETISQSVGRSLSSRWYCSILFSTENLLATCKFDRCPNLASKLSVRRWRSRPFRRVPSLRTRKRLSIPSRI